LVSSNQEKKPEKTKKLRANAENVKPQNKIMPSTAKQAKTNAFESIRATPFTRVHKRPTRRDYEVLKEEACAPASEVDDITYAWSKNVTDNYGLLADILGVDKYDDLTGNVTYAIPHEPASYDPNITDATPTHTRKQMEEEWELVWTSWFIRKGFLCGVVDNLRDALDEQYYSQLHPLPNSQAPQQSLMSSRR
jgi:hypothetical protein